MSHVGLLYGSEQDLLDEVVPYVRAGLQGDEHVLIVTTRARSALLEEALGAAAAAVEFVDAAAWYASPARALSAYAEVLRPRPDRRPVRVVGEQVLTGRPRDELRELCRVEAAANAVLPLEVASMLCVYDVRALGDEVAANVTRTHPAMLSGGTTTLSPDYVTPAAFLAAQDQALALAEPEAVAAQLTFPSDVAAARRFVAAHVAAIGLHPPAAADLVTAANEVITNAFVHGITCIVRMWQQPGRAVCEVRDYGLGLDDPLVGYRQPDGDQTRGRGLWLARQLVDLCEIQTGTGGTTVRLHVTIPR